MGYTLNEYSLADLEDREGRLPANRRNEIYASCNLDYIPPELRENLGEIDAAESTHSPALITLDDLQGDVTHCTPSKRRQEHHRRDGEAAQARGYNTWPSPRPIPEPGIRQRLRRPRASHNIQKIAEQTPESTASQSFARYRSGYLAEWRPRSFPTTYWRRWTSHPPAVHFLFNQGTGEDDRAPALRPFRIPILQSLAIPPAACNFGRDAYQFDMDAILTPRQNTRSPGV